MDQGIRNDNTVTVGELIDHYELEEETIVIHNGEIIEKEESLFAQEQM